MHKSAEDNDVVSKEGKKEDAFCGFAVLLCIGVTLVGSACLVLGIFRKLFYWLWG